AGRIDHLRQLIDCGCHSPHGLGQAPAESKAAQAAAAFPSPRYLRYHAAWSAPDRSRYVFWSTTAFGGADLAPVRPCRGACRWSKLRRRWRWEMANNFLILGALAGFFGWAYVNGPPPSTEPAARSFASRVAAIDSLKTAYAAGPVLEARQAPVPLVRS